MTFLVAASMWSCQVMFSLRSLMTCSLYLQLTNLHQVGSRVGRLPQNHFQIIFKLKFERTISSAYRNILFRFNFIFIHSHCLQYTNTVIVLLKWIYERSCIPMQTSSILWVWSPLLTQVNTSNFRYWAHLQRFVSLLVIVSLRVFTSEANVVQKSKSAH